MGERSPEYKFQLPKPAIAARFSDDDDASIAICDNTGRISIVDLKSRKIVQSVDNVPPNVYGDRIRIDAWSKNVVCLGNDRRFIRVDMATGKIIESKDLPCDFVALDHKHRRLFLCGNRRGNNGGNDRFVILDAESRAVQCDCEFETRHFLNDQFTAIAWSDDGRYVAVGMESGILMLFELTKAKN